MAGQPLRREQERVAGPDGVQHLVKTFTDPGAAALQRSSAHQVKVDGSHIGWARDGEELAALLARVREALGAGWTPDSGELPARG